MGVPADIYMNELSFSVEALVLQRCSREFPWMEAHAGTPCPSRTGSLGGNAGDTRLARWSLYRLPRAHRESGSIFSVQPTLALVIRD